MEYFIHIAGALGAWLLVAGPLYQASLELAEEEFDREGMQVATSGVPVPGRVSPWWWLLPPVAYVKTRRRSREHREAVMAALGPEQLEQTVNFMNKARGWFIVGAGAFFIALKETWEVTELLEWPVGVFVALVLLAFLAAVSNTVLSARRTHQLLGKATGRSTPRRPR